MPKNTESWRIARLISIEVDREGVVLDQVDSPSLLQPKFATVRQGPTAGPKDGQPAVPVVALLLLVHLHHDAQPIQGIVSRDFLHFFY